MHPAGSMSRESRHARLLSAVFSEPVMGFFAILALALSLGPLILELSPAVDDAFEVCQWAIIGLFTLEYVVGLVRAEDRARFALSGWRLLDLVILAGPFASLVLPTWTAARATPVLRLFRVALFSMRLGGLAVRQAPLPTAVAAKGPVRISTLAADAPPHESSWEEFSARLVHPPDDEWFHASGLDRSHVAEIARDTGIAPAFLAQTLEETAYPRVEVYDRFSALFTWIPSLADDDDATVERNGVLLLATETGVLTLAQRAVGLQDDIVASMQDVGLPKGEFAQRSILAILKHVLRRYEAVAGHLERHTRALELLPVRDSRTEFLERSFRIQRQVSTVKSDLWRLKGVLEAIVEKRLPFHGITRAMKEDDGEGRAIAEYMRVLADEASYIYETTFNTREALLALIDLHINVVSYELNKVMRVLAVLSGLGLIPAVVGGLLGMNILGNPWPISLAEVSFGVSTAMVLALYVFAVRGFLR